MKRKPSNKVDTAIVKAIMDSPNKKPIPGMGKLTLEKLLKAKKIFEEAGC